MKKFLSFFLTITVLLVLAACGDSTKELLKEAKDSLEIGYQSGDSASSVTQDLTLPTKGKNDVVITWKSSNTDVIANDGKVTRPENGKGDAQVTLTATLRLKDDEDKKEFTLTVKEIAESDEDKAEAIKEKLEVGLAAGDTLTEVTSDLILPTSLDGATITWSSSNQNVVTNDGKVNRPAYGQNDASAALTATIKVGDAEVQKVFLITVLAEDTLTDEDAVKETASKIIILNGEHVTKADFNLPLTGANQTTITWTSSNPDVITIDGDKAVVTLPENGEGDATVTLTAKVTKGDAEATRTFEIRVQEKDPDLGGTIEGVLEQPKGTAVVLDEVIVFGVIGDGYYVYDETGFMFVFTKNEPEGVKVGDKLSLRGEFDIYYNQPEIVDPYDVQVIDSGNSLPTPEETTIKAIVNFDTADKSVYSKYYKVRGTVVLSGQYNDVFLKDAEGNEIDINYKSNADVLKDFVGKEVEITLALHTFRTDTEAWRLSFLGTAEDVTTFEVSEEEQLQNAVDSLKLPETVYSNLTLVDKLGDVAVQWTIEENDAIANDGVVTRGAQDVTVTIKATLTLGELEPAEKEFTVTVKAIDVQRVEDLIADDETGFVLDVEGIVVAVINRGFLLHDGTGTIYVYQNATPDVKKGDVVRVTGEYTVYNEQPEVEKVIAIVKVESDQYQLPVVQKLAIEDIIAKQNTEHAFYGQFISIEGKLIKVISGSYTDWFLEDEDGNQIGIYHESAIKDLEEFENDNITIHAYIYRNYKGTWQVVYYTGDPVELDLTDEELLERAKNKLELPTTATSDLTLPTADGEITIAWDSSHPDVISTTGVVARPEVGSADVEVTLTATLTLGDEEPVKVTFKVTVKAQSDSSEGLQYTETFDDDVTGLKGSYSDVSFTGTNGVEWVITHSRNVWDNNNGGPFPIEDDGVLLRRASDSSITATFTNGLVSFSFEYRKAYTGGRPRQLEIIITDEENNEIVLETPEFGEGTGAQEDVYTFESDELNLTGTVTLKIKLVGTSDSNAQCVVDNFSWTE